MEIRIYRSFEHFSGNKPFYTARVECLDTFSPERSLDVFRSIYGPKIVIVFIYA